MKMCSKIEETILKQVSTDNYFVWKKANLLFRFNCLLIVVTIVITIPAHILDFPKHPILAVGDFLFLFGLILSIFFLGKGNVFIAGIVTDIALIMVPLLHNVIGDWLFPNDITEIRYFETMIMVCFILPLIILYSIKLRQIVIGTILSMLVVLGHFLVLRNVVGVDISYMYLLYLAIVLIIGKVGFSNLRLTNEAIESLVRSKNQMMEWNKSLEEMVEQRTEELVETNNRLEAMSNTDGLTGIGNRRQFDNYLTVEWSYAQRTNCNLALVFGDVDWFKNYNDMYGHLAGDECLRIIAQVFQDSARRESDLVARYGGEEFAAIFPVNTKNQAIIFAERLIKSMQELNLTHSGSPFGYVTISLGVAVIIPKADQTVEALVRAADAALYIAKNKGRNQYVLWDNEKLPIMERGDNGK